MFAALTLEREPLTFTWDSLLGSLISWTQIAGGFAMLALILWLIAYVASRRGAEGGNAVVRVLAGPLGALLLIVYFARRNPGSGLANVNVTAGGPSRGTVVTALFIGAVVW